MYIYIHIFAYICIEIKTSIDDEGKMKEVKHK